MVGDGGNAGEYFDHESAKRQRRNLVLMSVWMILFMLGAIGFRESQAEIVSPLVAFAIKDKTLIEYSMWVLLAYFWWRHAHYSKSHKYEFNDAFVKRIESDDKFQRLANKAARARGIEGNPDTISFSVFRRYASALVLDVHGNVAGNVKVSLPLLAFLLIELKHQIVLSITHKTSSEFLFPHFIATAAVAIGLWKYF